MIGQTERYYKGVEAQFMKKKILVLLVCSMLTLPTTVSADILDYEGTVNAYKEDNKIPQTFEIDDGSGEKVTAVAKSDKVSVSAKATYIRSMPGKNGKKLARVYLGTGVERVAVCDNGWSKVTYEKKSKKGTEKISGYVPTKHINDSDQVAQARGTFTALKDSDILDYPGKKDGQIVGEVIQEDEVKRLATVNGIWSQIYYKKENGKRGIGYIPTSVLENTAAEAIKAGTLHVFDTTTFTVEGAELTSYEADVDTDADYAPDHEVVSDGYFHESEYRSAPYFNVQIDGINLLNTVF